MRSSDSHTLPQWTARQVVHATLIVASILVFFSLLYRFNHLVFIFLISIVLSTGIRPLVAKMHRHGLSRSGGVILLYLIGLSLVISFVILTLPVIVEQVADISRDLPMVYASFRSGLFQSSSRILSLIAAQLPDEVRMLTLNFSAASGEPLTQVARSVYYVGLFTRSLFTLTAILFLAFYWTLEGERSIRSLLLWIPVNRREPVREIIAEAEDKVGGFILGQSILCLSIGAMALVAYYLIGLPYTLVLAIIAGIMEAVPVVGPALGAIPAILVAFSFDPAKAGWVILASLLIQGLENYLLVPRVMKRSVGVNPMLVLLTIAAFTSLFGVAGALLAIPVAAVIQLSIDRIIIKPAETDVPSPDGRGQVSMLRYEAQSLEQDIRKQLRPGEDQQSSTDHLVDSLEAITRDLDQLLAESEQRMVDH